MTPEETQMLNDLAEKIAKTPAPAHDAEAEQLIRTRIGSRPDALYLMTQTVLIQNMALDHARQQIQDLQQRTGAVAAAPPPNYGQTAPPAYPAPSYSSPAPGGVSSFLRSAATTAAGVAAGALAFEGIRSLFGGMGHLGGFGGGAPGSFLSGAPGSETVINNYYDSPEQSGRDETNDDDSDTQAAGQDADDSGSAGDDSAADSADDSGDNSGGDDSGGGDSGGGDWT